MNIGIFFAIIAVGVIWFFAKETTLGFEIRAVGFNPHASEYAGISAKRLNHPINDYLWLLWLVLGSGRRSWYLPKRLRSGIIISYRI